MSCKTSKSTIVFILKIDIFFFEPKRACCNENDKETDSSSHSAHNKSHQSIRGKSAANFDC